MPWVITDQVLLDRYMANMSNPVRQALTMIITKNYKVPRAARRVELTPQGINYHLRNLRVMKAIRATKNEEDLKRRAEKAHQQLLARIRGSIIRSLRYLSEENLMELREQIIHVYGVCPEGHKMGRSIWNTEKGDQAGWHCPECDSYVPDPPRRESP